MKFNMSSFPTCVPAFIEISKHSNIKYEWDPETNLLTLDRILHSSVIYPENYGFIPDTLGDDGDPIDILVLSNHPLQPGTLVYVRPIGFMDMTDEKGKDEKVLAIIEKEPYFQNITSISQISKHKLAEIAEFFSTYKNLEPNKWSNVGKWYDTNDTYTLLQNSMITDRTMKLTDTHKNERIST